MRPLSAVPASTVAPHVGGREHGGIVVGWLTKIVVLVVLGGIIVFDGLSVAVAKVAVEDDAKKAAMAASSSYQESPDVQLAYDAAVDSLGGTDANIPVRSFKISPDGTVTLRVVRVATTLTLRYFKPADPLTKANATYTGRSELV